jgi:hypothetical protein
MKNTLRFGAILRARFSTDALPRTVRLVEVGPRDGLQNDRTVCFSRSKRAARVVYRNRALPT